MGTINPVNKSFCLEKLCETNYQKLLRLNPNLLSLKEPAIAYSEGKPTLHMEIAETSKYTLTVLLSHCFETELDAYLDPALKIRIYRDAKLAEVIRDHNKSDVTKMINKLGQIEEIMDYKWSLNYFLEKWLDHCLLSNYHFKTSGLMLAESE